MMCILYVAITWFLQIQSQMILNFTGQFLTMINFVTWHTYMCIYVCIVMIQKGGQVTKSIIVVKMVYYVYS